MYITRIINMNRVYPPVKGIVLDKYSVIIADCRIGGRLNGPCAMESKWGLIEAAPPIITGEGPVVAGFRKKEPSEKVDFPDGSFKIPV